MSKFKTNTNDEFKIDLINFVRSHPVLYDTTLLEYKDATSKQELWDEFGKLHQMTPDYVCKEWQCLRNGYRNAKNRYLARQSMGIKQDRVKLWRFSNEMQFLDNFFLIDQNLVSNQDRKKQDQTNFDLDNDETDDESMDINLNRSNNHLNRSNNHLNRSNNHLNESNHKRIRNNVTASASSSTTYSNGLCNDEDKDRLLKEVHNLRTELNEFKKECFQLAFKNKQCETISQVNSSDDDNMHFLKSIKQHLDKFSANSILANNFKIDLYKLINQYEQKFDSL